MATGAATETHIHDAIELGLARLTVTQISCLTIFDQRSSILYLFRTRLATTSSTGATEKVLTKATKRTVL